MKRQRKVTSQVKSPPVSQVNDNINNRENNKFKTYTRTDGEPFLIVGVRKMKHSSELGETSIVYDASTKRNDDDWDWDDWNRKWIDVININISVRIWLGSFVLLTAATRVVVVVVIFIGVIGLFCCWRRQFDGDPVRFRRADKVVVVVVMNSRGNIQNTKSSRSVWCLHGRQDHCRCCCIGLTLLCFVVATPNASYFVVNFD